MNPQEMTFNQLGTDNEFIRRHIGPSAEDQKTMLKTLGFSSLEELAKQVVPKNIFETEPAFKATGLGEKDLLEKLKSMVSKNKVYKSLIGQGYYDTITPPVIQRNVLENPVWYTAYTPYQAEIAQGRLEALLNFQTMIKELTGMEISNASLLDEGTAAAEAMAMAHALQKKNTTASFLVSPQMHPQTIEVLKTRAEPLGLNLILQNPFEFDFSKNPVFAVFLQYPNTEGLAEDYKQLCEKAHHQGAFVIAATDLLALTLLTPPGEWGADIVVGNSQRFGVPMGFGGPHAAFLSTKEDYKRLMPGRLVGVSIDSQGKPALRLALQTREQHIRREKATSNICTAQVLLANMASFYAVYHGPVGLQKIALRTHGLTTILAQHLQKLGFTLLHKNFFDTLVVKTGDASKILFNAEKLEMNLRKIDNEHLGISLDETCDLSTVKNILKAFNHLNDVQIDTASLNQKVSLSWPSALVRKSKFLTHPVFSQHQSETELLRYIHSLQNKDVTLAHSMIPLGSCTMKLNATTELAPVSWPEINKIHPFAPAHQVTGYLEMIRDLEHQLCQITGFSAVSLQPNAGSQGEYAGLLVIRKYHESRKEIHRNICLIPSSAHGTNPASAVMAGMQVIVVQCDDQGNVDIKDLKQKAELHKNNLSCLMITYPSTHGVFEEGIREICDIVHSHGGQVYMDGANMNALVGMCRPGQFGPDVSHLNLHKTFAIPHGGGGPGVGPIGVREHLKSFLPQLSFIPESGPSTGISSTTSAPWGSASILPISWAYITMMGGLGLRQATLVSILSANYIAKKLETLYPILYKGKEGLVAHECILDLRNFKKTAGVDVTDVAKRLIDYGFHAPTMSWPVAGTLMVEPTESESLPEIDRFIEAMVSIHSEIKEIENKKIDAENNPLKNSPHTAAVLLSEKWDHPYSREKAAFPLKWILKNKIFPAVGRVDNAHGDRNLVCECPPMDSYQ
jgi:glycine dehydrogenase